MTTPSLLQAAIAQAPLRSVYDRAPSTFDAVGPEAARLATLGWIMIVIATVVFVVVMAILLLPIWRRRHAPPTDHPPVETNDRAWVLYGGALVPALILAGVFVLTLSTLRATAAPANMPLTVEVIGHQWWWEVRYPSLGIVTADEIHVPAGQNVRVLLTSPDVIHSFWVPNLAGKTDLIPGQPNSTWLRSDTAGVWRGECAEYCGMQHAHMALSVVAQPAGAFARWAALERANAPQPADSATLAGEQAFQEASCASCHTVRGTRAGGMVGPDLTHLASRLTLAGGTLANTRGNLAGWIENPDRVKPGTKMPAIPLDGPTLEAIVGYLESLR